MMREDLEKTKLSLSSQSSQINNADYKLEGNDDQQFAENLLEDFYNSSVTSSTDTISCDKKPIDKGNNKLDSQSKFEIQGSKVVKELNSTKGSGLVLEKERSPEKDLKDSDRINITGDIKHQNSYCLSLDERVDQFIERKNLPQTNEIDQCPLVMYLKDNDLTNKSSNVHVELGICKNKLIKQSHKNTDLQDVSTTKGKAISVIMSGPSIPSDYPEPCNENPLWKRKSVPSASGVSTQSQNNFHQLDTSCGQPLKQTQNLPLQQYSSRNFPQVTGFNEISSQSFSEQAPNNQLFQNNYQLQSFHEENRFRISPPFSYGIASQNLQSVSPIQICNQKQSGQLAYECSCPSDFPITSQISSFPDSSFPDTCDQSSSGSILIYPSTPSTPLLDECQDTILNPTTENSRPSTLQNNGLENKSKASSSFNKNSRKENKKYKTASCLKSNLVHINLLTSRVNKIVSSNSDIIFDDDSMSLDSDDSSNLSLEKKTTDQSTGIEAVPIDDVDVKMVKYFKGLKTLATDEIVTDIYQESCMPRSFNHSPDEVVDGTLHDSDQTQNVKSIKCDTKNSKIVEDITAMQLSSDVESKEDITAVQLPSENEDIKDVQLSSKVVSNEDIKALQLSSELVSNENISAKQLSSEVVSNEDITAMQLSSEAVSNEDITAVELSSEVVPNEDITAVQLSSEVVTNVSTLCDSNEGLDEIDQTCSSDYPNHKEETEIKGKLCWLMLSTCFILHQGWIYSVTRILTKACKIRAVLQHSLTLF